MTDDPADDVAEDTCPICGAHLSWVRCWAGCDDGYVGDDEDPLNEFEVCRECSGAGGYLECSALPHSEQQMEAYRRRQAQERERHF